MDCRRFADGSITKIVYHNFLTYDDVECKPGPNLNVFIGTNGAGKSTVICGICLAVGGSPKVLGRSERMEVEIALGTCVYYSKFDNAPTSNRADSRNGEQRVKILLQRPNKCTYFINGSKVTQHEVRNLVASYNIQVDNPCTFLAQDKVKSFSEQSPVDLLMNTERAGDPHLLKKHEELIKKKKDEAIYTENAREIKQRLLDVDRELTVLLPRAENYKKKEFLRTKIGILEKKKAILDFQECSMRYAAVDETVKELRIAVEYIKKQIENIRKESAGKLKKKSEYEENHVDAVCFS
ncbi:RecF/RecN/SMC protein [Dictyocaulus viviparus]|uniref:Structural maintenance of chromosomes protein 5 n=1 Tax=Dictyocaulus viviparus TaxID=29172 RepID=A0A0D8XYP6_DICVI|nr:RecF/RecN/SMC protein [Dictyocaulus viviparus]